MNKDLISKFHKIALKQLPRIVDYSLEKGKNRTRYNSKEIKSEIDKRVETDLYKLFKDKLGDSVSIVREEGADDKNNSRYKLLIDPIDGTKNFASGNPLFAASVGLWDTVKNEPVSGVVYVPKLNELYSWKLGEKSKLNGKVITPSKTRELKNSLVSVCFLRDRADFKSNWDRMGYWYSKVAKEVYGFRILQSDALSLCWVASGKLDAAFLVGSRDFDTAGGLAICSGAGCAYTQSDTNMFGADGTVLVAANNKVFGHLVQIIGNYEERE